MRRSAKIPLQISQALTQRENFNKTKTHYVDSRHSASALRAILDLSIFVLRCFELICPQASSVEDLSAVFSSHLLDSESVQ